MNIDPMAGHDQESDKILKAEIALTDHAYMRIKQRMGLSKESAVRMAERAFSDGIDHSETTGRLNKYLIEEAYKYKKPGTRIVIYGEMVYCFVRLRTTKTGENFAVLITVIYIPNNLKNNVLGLQKRKKK